MILEIPFIIVKGCDPIILRPMYSKTEKSILEYSVMNDDIGLIFDMVCKALDIPDYLPEELKIACIYKIREISFGSDLRLRFTCDKCKRLTESVLIIEDVLYYNDYDGNLSLKERDLKEVLSAKISNSYRFLGLSTPQKMSDMARYAIDVRNRIPRLKSTLQCKCFFCQHQHDINITKKRFVIDSLSEHTALSMIKMYNALAMNGFTKRCVDDMLPFERELHGALFKERTEQLKPKVKDNG